MKLILPTAELRIYSGKKERLLYEKIGDPWVIGYIDFYYGNHINSNITIKDTSGTNRVCSPSYMGCMGVAGVDYAGIVIGTGTDAVLMTDYNLIAKIAYGTGSGQFIYMNTYAEGVGTYGTTEKFIISRLFGNFSGGAITVNEVGLVGSQYDTGWRILLARDLVAGGLSVSDGTVITVEYLIKITV